MKASEFYQIVAAVILLFIVSSFYFALRGEWNLVLQIFFFSFIIIFVSVVAKKAMAHMLDADVEHQLWKVSKYGPFPHQHFKKEASAGAALPLIFSIITLGTVKVMTFLTYEARALKIRAAKRFGFYSYNEITEWHNGLIGAAGIVAILVLAIVAYLLPSSYLGLEYFTKMAVYFAFFNMLPISNLDGSQIYSGSRVIWTTLATITLIFTVYALFILI